MTTSVYVDGSGGPTGGHGFLVMETGESFYDEKPGITSNQAEYMAVIAALRRFAGSDDKVVIFSDSLNTVKQINHEYAINNDRLRDLARTVWGLADGSPGVSFEWIPRKENPAGRMLGS